MFMLQEKYPEDTKRGKEEKEGKKACTCAIHWFIAA